MKLLSFLLILLGTVFMSQPAFAQKKKTKAKAKVENVHMYYDVSPAPLNMDDSEWISLIMNEMRAKWNPDSLKVNLSFIVEKNGTLSDPKISSDKWKPTKQDLIDLNKIINSQGKWSAAKIGKNDVRGKYFLTLQFR